MVLWHISFFPRCLSLFFSRTEVSSKLITTLNTYYVLIISQHFLFFLLFFLVKDLMLVLYCVSPVAWSDNKQYLSHTDKYPADNTYKIWCLLYRGFPSIGEYFNTCPLKPGRWHNDSVFVFCLGDCPFESEPSTISAHACGEVTGCAPEVDLRDCTLHLPP